VTVDVTQSVFYQVASLTPESPNLVVESHGREVICMLIGEDVSFDVQHHATDAAKIRRAAPGSERLGGRIMNTRPARSPYGRCIWLLA